jgi:hypothetical protein
MYCEPHRENAVSVLGSEQPATAGRLRSHQQPAPLSNGRGLRCDAEMPGSLREMRVIPVQRAKRRCEICVQLIAGGQRSTAAAQAKVKRLGDQYNSLCPPHAREEGVATEQLAKIAAVRRTYVQSAEGQVVQRTYAQSAEGQAVRRTYEQSAGRQAVRRTYEQSAEGQALTRTNSQDEA